MTSAVYKHLSIEQAMEYIGDKDGVRSLLQTLEQSLAKDTPEIQVQIDKGDLPAANRLLHQFKGFAPVFCVPDLVQEIVNIEKLSKGTDLSAVRQAYIGLAPKLHDMLTEVRSHLAA